MIDIIVLSWLTQDTEEMFGLDKNGVDVVTLERERVIQRQGST